MTDLITKWEKTGLLDKLYGDEAIRKMAQLLENQQEVMDTVWKPYIQKYQLDTEIYDWVLNVMPSFVRIAFGRLVNHELIDVVPTVNGVVPQVCTTRKMCTIDFPEDNFINPDIHVCFGPDCDIFREAEWLQNTGWQVSQELFGKLESSYTKLFWYQPFSGWHLITDPVSGKRRFGPMTRYRKVLI